MNGKMAAQRYRQPFKWDKYIKKRISNNNNIAAIIILL